MSEKAAFWGCTITSIMSFLMIMHVGGPWAAMSGSGYLGIPVMFWSIALSIVLYVVISLFNPYDVDQMSQACLYMFKMKTNVDSNKDILVFGIIWIVTLIIGIFKKNGVAFPVLSGKLAWMTDGVFILTASFTV